jgi:hypothetical protein
MMVEIVGPATFLPLCRIRQVFSRAASEKSAIGHRLGCDRSAFGLDFEVAGWMDRAAKASRTNHFLIGAGDEIRTHDPNLGKMRRLT